MLQSLVISKVESDSIGASSLECQMSENDYEIVKAHPHFIFLLGVQYRQSGWNSDRKVIHYKRVR